MKRKIVTSVLVGAALAASSAACRKKGSSTNNSSTAAPDSTTSPQDVKDVDSATVNDKTSSLTIPGALNLFTSAGGASLADYDTDQGHFNVDDQSLDSLSTISMIMCFLGHLDYADDKVVNKGPYIATLDMGICDKSSGGSSGGGSSSSSGGKQVQMINVTVDSKRPENKPLSAKVWFDQVEGGGGGGGSHTSRLALNLTVAQGPSDINPLGIFRMTFVQKIVKDDGSTAPSGTGLLETKRNDKGQVLLRFVSNDDRQQGSGEEKSDQEASVILKIDNSTPPKVTGGIARLHQASSSTGQSGSGGGGGGNYSSDESYTLDWNQQFFSGHGTATSSDPNQKAPADFCKDQNQFNMNVWSYGLYDNTSKNRIKLNGGMPLTGNVGGKPVHAFASYYGLWADNNQTLPAGTVLTQDTYGDKSVTPATYKVVTSAGRLTKYTRTALTLDALDGLELDAWDQTNNQQVRVNYDKASKKFKKTGTMSNGGGNMSGPPSWTDVSPSVDYTLSTTGNSSFNSQALGGRVDIILDSNGTPTGAAVYSQQDVTATQSDITLYCVQSCLVGNITSAMITGNTDYQTPPSTNTNTNTNGGGSNSPNPWAPFPLTSPVTYKFNLSKMQLYAADGTTPIAMASGQTIPSSGMSPNIQSLVDKTTLDTMVSHNTPAFQAGQQDTSYSWSVGNPTQPWTMYMGLADSNGKAVNFDAPIVIPYTHTAANEASGDTSLKAIGHSFRLQYDGNNLQIPGHQDKDRGFYIADFSIKAGALSDDSKYVIKPLDGSRYMKNVDASKCAGLDPSKAPDLPSQSDFDPAKSNTDPAPDQSTLATLVVSGVYVGK